MITINVKGVELTLDEAQELKRELDRLFNTEHQFQTFPMTPAWPGYEIYKVGDVYPEPFKITC